MGETRVAVKAAIVDDGRLLILRRSGASEGVVDLPGGRVEFGEGPADALRREVVEETGLVVRARRPIDVWDWRPTNHSHVIGITFWCERASGQVRLGHEHSGFEWLSRSEITRLKAPWDERLLALLDWITDSALQESESVNACRTGQPAAGSRDGA